MVITMCSCDLETHWDGSWEGTSMPPVIPPPPVTNRATGSLSPFSAEAGVQMASERQSSADDQDVEPWSYVSPMFMSKLAGSYSFHILLPELTYWGQAKKGLASSDFRYLPEDTHQGRIGSNRFSYCLPLASPEASIGGHLLVAKNAMRALYNCIFMESKEVLL